MILAVVVAVVAAALPPQQLPLCGDARGAVRGAEGLVQLVEQCWKSEGDPLVRGVWGGAAAEGLPSRGGKLEERSR